ncbi:glycosyltransferase [Streptosporangiaceae bacterium NEAU-GS5]|nr:glycosyltransferase [Streptosporangiaceae bacterium NEAU-GS5]
MDIAIVSAHDVAPETPALARELAREHNVTVYTRSAIGGVGVERISAGPAGELSEPELVPYISDFSAALKRRWAISRPDVIHAHSWTSGLAAIAGSEGLNVPVTQTFHETAGGSTAPVLRLERAIGRRARTVIATCAAEESALIRLGVPRKNIAVVPSGVDVEVFRRQGPAMPRGERPRLLHVGHLGAPAAIRALASVPEAELVVAGGQEPDVERLHIVAGEHCVADRVVLLGHVQHDTMPRLMRSADVVLTLPSAAPVGMVALEAMACGVPVIASAVDAHLDSVIHGVTGYLVGVNRQADLVGRVRELLGDRTMRTAIGYAGVDRARSRYSLERISAELLRVYENACA